MADDIYYKYPDFDWLQYRKNYPDLEKLNKKKLENHWLLFGQKDNRTYKNVDIKNNINNNFDWIEYINNYEDLRNAGIDTFEKALNHWEKHGRSEGRTYEKIIYNILENNTKIEDTSILYYTQLPAIIDLDYNSILDYTQLPAIIDLDYNSILVDNNYINDNAILFTRKFNTDKILNCNTINNLDNYNTFILIVDFSNGGGGTTTFINFIISKYKTSQTFLIARNFDDMVYFYINELYCLDKKYNTTDSIQFLEEIKHKISKIFVNHTKDHNINFINKLFELGKHISSITHDHSLIVDKTQAYFEEIYKLNKSIINICKYDNIITQNIKNINIFTKFINPNKLIVATLPDYNKSKDLINTNNTKIVILFIGNITELKGNARINSIYEYYSNNNNIECILFGCMDNFKSKIKNIIYNSIDEFNNLLLQYKPNLIIETSIWPETYSFTLTLMMLTQLPIIYFKKTFDGVIKNRLEKYNKKYCIENISELDTFIYKVKQDYFYTIEPIVYFNSFWDNYFNSTISDANNSINDKIKTYCIYFPQFHSFPENDIAFYKDFTDIENLQLLVNENKLINILSPSLSIFNLDKMTDYNLLNKKIIQKQIDIISDYDIEGFALYYYWFSENTITNNNMIMKQVIDMFFYNMINMKNRKIFFIWANESWTNNIAFGSSSHNIINIYDTYNINKNIDNMMNYFNHVNYLKIDNMPVFFLHHPWFLTEEEVDLFYNLLNNKCKNNNYNGVHFVINSMKGYYKKYMNYNHNFNYKKNINNSLFMDDNTSYTYLDYKKYIENYDNDSSIHTIVFDFDNRARLFKPDKLNKSTICINNNEADKINFINTILKKYKKVKKSDVENILLINAWNEWGEKMSIEPSEQFGYYYLDLIKKYINLK